MEKEAEKVKRKPWYQVKIEELEAKVAELNAVALTQASLPASDDSRTEGYADGFVDCMQKYGVLSKLQRRRIKEQILAHGPGAVKSTKRSRFSLSVPSL